MEGTSVDALCLLLIISVLNSYRKKKLEHFYFEKQPVTLITTYHNSPAQNNLLKITAQINVVLINVANN